MCTLQASKPWEETPLQARCRGSAQAAHLDFPQRQPDLSTLVFIPDNYKLSHIVLFQHLRSLHDMPIPLRHMSLQSNGLDISSKDSWRYPLDSNKAALFCWASSCSFGSYVHISTSLIYSEHRALDFVSLLVAIRVLTQQLLEPLVKVLSIQFLASIQLTAATAGCRRFNSSYKTRVKLVLASSV